MSMKVIKVAQHTVRICHRRVMLIPHDCIAIRVPSDLVSVPNLSGAASAKKRIIEILGPIHSKL